MVDPDFHVTKHQPIRVFILDDHELVRRGLTDLLTTTDDLVIVGEAATAADALHRIPAAAPDVALLDARLPDGSGIDVCREIRSSYENVRCLILTSYDDDEALFAAIMAGAAGYTLKQVKGNDLVDAVRRVAAGQSMLDPSVTAQVLDRVRNGPPVDKELAKLTEQEQRILDLIGDGLTNRQIAERMYLSHRTVGAHLYRIYPKLGITSRNQLHIVLETANARHRMSDPHPGNRQA